MNTEPITFNTAIKELLSTGIKLLVMFGVFAVTTEQFGVLMIFVDSALAVVFLLWRARNASTPIDQPRVPEGTTVDAYNTNTGKTTSSVTLPSG